MTCGECRRASGQGQRRSGRTCDRLRRIATDCKRSATNCADCKRVVCKWCVQCGTPDDAQLDGGSVAENGQTPAEATQRGFRRMGRASSMTGLEPPWNAPRQNGWDSGPCRGSREVGRRYVSRHPCHGNGAGYANHNPRVTNHNPRGTVTANRPPLSRRFQFLINFQIQWSHNTCRHYYDQ